MDKPIVSSYLAVLLLAAVLAGCAGQLPDPTQTPAPTLPEPSATATFSPTPLPSATPSSTATPTPLPTATITPSPTATVIPAARIPIIEYHDPDFKLNDQVQMTMAWFEDQMKWLADNHYQTLDGEELSAYLDGTVAFPYKSVVLSFDVGTAKKPTYTRFGHSDPEKI